ncbi:hypothetical protein H311_01619 [Anncaliia algerae PRA109]|nr:hypothetical protein H311_01619 [Anncaliia algerae PRA109]
MGKHVYFKTKFYSNNSSSSSLVQRYLKAGQRTRGYDSIIHKNKHGSYIYYFGENSNKYYHDWVNHSENFVDPETYVHTQNIENLWLLLKKFKRRKGYSKSRYLKLYLAEFDLKRRFYQEESRLFEFLINLTFN